MPTPTLDSIELETGESPTHSIIWLHGLGADGHDFEPIVRELHLPANLAIRFIFPHAPVRPITLNGGMPMRGWYDLKSLELDRSSQDPEGVRDSSENVLAIVRQEMERGIAAENIIVAGFSQGGAIALFTALTGPVKLGGVMGLSTYLPMMADDFAQKNNGFSDIPFFLAHGEFDDVVQYKYALMSREAIMQAGFKPQWHSYKVAHGLNAEEVRDISTWLQGVIQNP
ncbi:MAG: alpha/beta fold hydrolase [Gammaproteobacteria bacterium]|nr:alpha/beta fold hydrolase [Gammaproteobacteria bacterium]